MYINVGLLVAFVVTSLSVTVWPPAPSLSIVINAISIPGISVPPVSDHLGVAARTRRRSRTSVRNIITYVAVIEPVYAQCLSTLDWTSWITYAVAPSALFTYKIKCSNVIFLMI